MIVESLAIPILGRVCGSQIVMENRSRDLTILWSDEDSLIGNPNRLSSNRASVSH